MKLLKTVRTIVPAVVALVGPEMRASCSYDTEEKGGTVSECYTVSGACLYSNGCDIDFYYQCISGDALDACTETYAVVGSCYQCGFNPNNQECYRYQNMGFPQSVTNYTNYCD